MGKLNQVQLELKPYFSRWLNSLPYWKSSDKSDCQKQSKDEDVKFSSLSIHLRHNQTLSQLSLFSLVSTHTLSFSLSLSLSLSHTHTHTHTHAHTNAHFLASIALLNLSTLSLSLTHTHTQMLTFLPLSRSWTSLLSIYLSISLNPSIYLSFSIFPCISFTRGLYFHFVSVSLSLSISPPSLNISLRRRYHWLHLRNGQKLKKINRCLFFF